MATEVSERLPGYVWHPMPDEVRHTTIAERRASLAAAQKAAEEAKKKNGQPEPVETQQNGQHAEEPQEPATAQPEEQQHVEEQPEEPQPEEEEQPQQQEEEEQPQPEEEEQPQEEPQAAAAAAPEEEPVIEEEEAPAAAPAVQEPTTTGTKRSSKTKHTVHFRGARWEKALKNDRKRIQAAFRKDVHNATGIDENRMENVELNFDKVLYATFIVRHHSEDTEITKAHAKLNSYKFPLTTALYPKS